MFVVLVRSHFINIAFKADLHISEKISVETLLKRSNSYIRHAYLGNRDGPDINFAGYPASVLGRISVKT